MKSIYSHINRLLNYCLYRELIIERDVPYHKNNLLKVLKLDVFEANDEEKGDELSDSSESVEDILNDITEWAIHSGLLKDPTVEEQDLFDTSVIGVLVPMPSIVEARFWKEYQQSPQHATNFYYDFSHATNYIREKRIAKDEKWSVKSKYGTIDISINLSKPEKDPRDIAKAKTITSSHYPKCLLCLENENYAGRIGHPARDNHRLIEMQLQNEKWYLQYSPYVYYNEHCIILKASHDPMKLTRATFYRMMDFLSIFPHYFIGSNADLPIVGGSILSHDHFQGGNTIFPMEIAKELEATTLKNSDVTVSILHWPVSVLRLRGKNPREIAELSFTILNRWKSYSDRSAGIVSHSDELEHNTVTPIARFRNAYYEMDLALRNNRTDETHPFGIFHPRESLHSIKKENIGLIEVMGLAILPARLNKEMKELGDYMVRNDLQSIASSAELSKHLKFAKEIIENYNCTSNNIQEILRENIGKIFVRVLEDAGVFKTDENGFDAFKRAKEVLLENL